jgi:hypothetical protein
MEKFVILKAVSSHISNIPQKRNNNPENFKVLGFRILKWFPNLRKICELLD